MNNLSEQTIKGYIYESTNYDLFDFFTENRDPKKSENHVKKLINLIEEGYEMPPIQVDKNGMIIDGQHRFLAWQRLKMPIVYFITEYHGRSQLGLMNGTGQRLWKIKDHILSLGVTQPDYLILEKYQNELGLGYRKTASILSKKSMTNKDIKEGYFEIDPKNDLEEFSKVYSKYFEVLNLKQHTKHSIYHLWKLDGVDLKRVQQILSIHKDELKMFFNSAPTTQFIVEKYNYNQKKYKIHSEFKKDGTQIYSTPHKNPEWIRGDHNA